MREPIGHVDFYPNGGYNNPGCDTRVQDFLYQDKGSFFWGIQQFLSCNHIRSHQFMTDSIKHRYHFNGISCESYDDFKRGHCFECNVDGHNCFRFGLDSINSYHHLIGKGRIINNNPIRVYLMTNGKSPFCQTQYKVTLRMSASEESSTHGGEIGLMSIQIHNHNVTENKTDTEKMSFSQSPE